MHQLSGIAMREDTDPSGPASVEWFNRWVATGNSTHRERIIVYNEDDCRAMRVLVDALREIRVQAS